MTPQTYDVVVIGAGHNGLVAANYLADAGQRVIVIEAAPKIGGMTSSARGLVPDAPDHVINPCAVDPIWWNAFPASRDLDLERYGLRWITVDPCYAYLAPEGESIAFWCDPSKTADEIRYFSKTDAAAYLEFARFLDGLCDITSPLMETNPTRPSARALARTGKAVLAHRKDLGRYAAFGLSSAAEVINERFKHPMTRNALHTLAGGLYSTTIPGSTFLLIAIGMFGRVLPGRALGGTQAIPDALARRLDTVGGVVRTGSPVREIIVSGNRATSVCLADGTTINATRAVLATCDPITALGRLLPSGTLPADIESRVTAIPNYLSGSGTLKVDMALSGRLDLSRHNRLRRDGLDMRIPSHFLGTEAGLQRSYARTAAGLLPDVNDLFAWTCIPTAHDPSQAPPGQDTLYIWSTLTPLSPEDGSGDIRDKLGQIAVDFAALHYGGIAEFEIGRTVVTHEDLGRNKWCEPARGGLMHCDALLSRSGPLRPALGLGGYRTPVDGLYLGGAGSHPGGGVTGAPGHNSAQEILRSVRRHKR